jgi:hypothetical protein
MAQKVQGSMQIESLHKSGAGQLALAGLQRGRPQRPLVLQI